MKKRLISLAFTLFAVCLLTAALAVGSNAYDGEYYCGDGLTWSLDADTGVLTISGTGDMCNDWGPNCLEFYRAPWNFTDSISIFGNEGAVSETGKQIKSVVIEEGVTSIGQYAFYYCINIESVTIPKSMREIHVSAFEGCAVKTVYISDLEAWCGIKFEDTPQGSGTLRLNGEAVTDLVIPEGTTTILNNAFKGFNIKSVTIPNSVTSIGDDAFNACYALESVTIPNSVTSIGNDAFNACYALESIAIPNSVKEIGYRTFRNCTSLSNVSGFGGIESVGSNVFYNTVIYNDGSNWEDGVLYVCGCLIATDASFSSETYSVKSGTKVIASSAFQYRRSIVEVTLPDGLRTVGDYAFYNCPSLSAINIPNSVSTIGLWAFRNCSALKGAVIIPDSVTELGAYAFENCSAIESAAVGDGVTQIDEYTFNKCTSLADVKLGKNITRIGKCAFKGCAFTELVIPDKVAALDKNTFSECKKLKSVTVPVSLVTMGYAPFYSCVKLTDVYYGGSQEQWESANVSGYYPSAATVHFHYPDHFFGEWLCSATCISGGRTYRICSYCGEIEVGDAVPATKIHTRGEALSVTAPTCTCGGYTTYVCSVCGKQFTDDRVEPTGHKWSAWTVTKAATMTEAGERWRKCSVCGIKDTQPVPAYNSISVSGVTVTLGNASILNLVRYAPGVYTTARQIKSASGAGSFTESRIADGITPDGEFSFDLASNGVYSFYLRFNDGTDCVLSGVDCVDSNPAIVGVDGAKITIRCVEGVKDFFIARGICTAYRDVKGANSVAHYSAPSARDYVYTFPNKALSETNEYTLYFRFDDEGKRDYFIHFSLDLPNPEITVVGRDLHIDGLEGLKVIRTALGSYDTAGEVKRAAGARSFSAKTYLKNGATEFNIRYRDDGEYTLVAVYENGYEKVFRFTVRHLEPTVKVDGNTVTFGNLDALYVIRYAEGYHADSAAVKAAAGSKYLKPRSIDLNGEITVRSLSGEYTFVVQYTDESQNVYHLTFN